MPKFEAGKGPDGPPKPPTTRPMPQYIEPRCHVCTSDNRKNIDKMIAMGTSYSEIARFFELEGIDRRSIANHAKRHLNYEEAAIQQIIAEEAQAIEADVEQGVRGALMRRTYLNVGLRKALDAMLQGDIIVEPKDAIAMIQVLDKLDGQTESAQVEEIRTQFNAFVQAMREILPPDLNMQVVARTKELLDQQRELPPGE